MNIKLIWIKICGDDIVNAIITPKEKESYKEYIQRILLARENRKDTNTYQERHHILPKTLGGDNSKNNLIWLYAQEHYYAHKLLAIENPKEKGLQLAWWNMCQCTQNGERKYNILADEYAYARDMASKVISESKKGIVLTEKHKHNLCGHGRSVINITTGDRYNSIKAASENTGINGQHICECCNGKRGSAGRNNDEAFIWRYLGEEDKDFGFNLFYFQKKILCIETGVVYNSIRDANNDTGVHRRTIRTDCQNTSSRQNKNRLHFSYYNDPN